MAQFDFYAMPDHSGFWVDCQTELMESYQTRLVVPLVPSEEAPKPNAAQLNPKFEIGGRAYELLTQFAGVIPHDELGQRVGSLENQRYAILNALDFLISGV
jgi:toxin CcdB